MNLHLNHEDLERLGQKLPLTPDLLPSLCNPKILIVARDSLIPRGVRLVFDTWTRYLMSYYFLAKEYSVEKIAQHFDVSASLVLKESCDFVCSRNEAIAQKFCSLMVPSLDHLVQSKLTFSQLCPDNEFYNEIKNLVLLDFPLNNVSKDQKLTFKIRECLTSLEKYSKPKNKKNWPITKFSTFLPQDFRWKILIQGLGIFLFYTLIIALIVRFNNVIDDKKLELESLASTGLTWENSGLKFKDESQIATKEVKVAQKNWEQVSQDILPLEFKGEKGEDSTETEIFDTSVAIAGVSPLAVDFRDRYLGKAKAYRMMLNSADIFDSRIKIMELMKNYQAKDAGVPLVGKESLGGVYFNFFVPSDKIKNFMIEVEALFPSQIYISKTNSTPPPGSERVFLWLKKN